MSNMRPRLERLAGPSGESSVSVARCDKSSFLCVPATLTRGCVAASKEIGASNKKSARHYNCQLVGVPDSHSRIIDIFPQGRFFFLRLAIGYWIGCLESFTEAESTGKAMNDK